MPEVAVDGVVFDFVLKVVVINVVFHPVKKGWLPTPSCWTVRFKRYSQAVQAVLAAAPAGELEVLDVLPEASPQGLDVLGMLSEAPPEELEVLAVLSAAPAEELEGVQRALRGTSRRTRGARRAP